MKMEEIRRENHLLYMKTYEEWDILHIKNDFHQQYHGMNLNKENNYWQLLKVSGLNWLTQKITARVKVFLGRSKVYIRKKV